MSKDTIIKFRVTSDEKAAAEAVAKSRQTTLSEMVRAFLAGTVKENGAHE